MAICVKRVSALVLAAAAGTAMGGGSSENVLLVVNPASHDAMAAANYYKASRGVPDANVLYIDPAAVDYAAFTGVTLDAFFGTLAGRSIEGHIDYVLVMPGTAYAINAPDLVSDICVVPMTKFSTASCFTMAFIADEVLSGTLAQSEPNRYSAGPTNPAAFHSSLAYLTGQPSEDANARRYFIGAMLGYTGENGNTLAEIYDLVDRSVGADGSRPTGTFYFMNNTQSAARNVRAPTYPAALGKLADAGAVGEIIDGTLPTGRHDALGIMSGFASKDVAGANMTLIPGAFCDHLTSFAATFDTSSQTKVAEWIVKGASGSVGTIQEPCNITGKFPKANQHATYAKGFSLGEMALRGLRNVPFQGLIYGDPLTRPWAYIPAVSVPDAPGGPVSGVLAINPVATTSDPNGGIGTLEMYVDGVLVDTNGAGGGLSIDTSGLDEGFHELRVRAIDDTVAESVGNWIGSVEVNNSAHDASASVGAATGDLGTVFSFSIDGSGGATAGARVWSSGRVVGAADALPVSVGVHGRMLGVGVSDVRVEVLFDDGTSVWAAPISLNVDDVDPGSDGSTPIAYGYERTISTDHAWVIELPGTFGDGLETASWDVVSGPSQSMMYAGTGPYRVIVPNSEASGTDTLSFSITTGSGTSSVATITLDYGPADCVADVNGDGVLDFFDVQAFLTLFSLEDPSTDLNEDGLFDFFDVQVYLGAYSAGCP
jgi:hypothetical protein